MNTLRMICMRITGLGSVSNYKISLLGEKISVIKFPWKKTSQTTTLTDVPPNVIIVSNLKRCGGGEASFQRTI